jgi:2'-5' RNA ligase
MSGTIGACRVEEVVLYESRLSPRGATYTALVQGALGGER